jgi:hypothetical protein
MFRYAGGAPEVAIVGCRASDEALLGALVMMTRWHTSVEVLDTATSIEPSAFSDILVVDGNTISNSQVLATRLTTLT